MPLNSFVDLLLNEKKKKSLENASEKLIWLGSLKIILNIYVSKMFIYLKP